MNTRVFILYLIILLKFIILNSFQMILFFKCKQSHHLYVMIILSFFRYIYTYNFY